MAKVQYFIAKPHSVDLNWYLQDIDTGTTFIATEEEVKDYVRKKRKNVINLELDANDNLVKRNPFEFHMQSVEGIRNAPEAVRDLEGVIPTTNELVNQFESSMDLMIRSVVDEMGSLTKGKVTGKVLDQDKNLFQLNIKVKDNKIFRDKYMMVLVRYEQVQYCYKRIPEGNGAFGDIMLGIRAVRLPDGTVQNFETGSAPLSSFFPLDDDEEFEVSNELVVKKTYDTGLKSETDKRCLEAFDIQVASKPRTFMTVASNYDILRQNHNSLFLLDNNDEKFDVASAINSCVSALMLQASINYGISADDIKGALSLFDFDIVKAQSRLSVAAKKASVCAVLADEPYDIERESISVSGKVGGIFLSIGNFIAHPANNFQFALRCIVGAGLALFGVGILGYDLISGGFNGNHVLTTPWVVTMIGSFVGSLSTCIVAAKVDPDSWASPLDYIESIFTILLTLAESSGDSGSHHHRHHNDHYRSYGTHTTTHLSSGSASSSLGSSRGSSLSSGSSSRVGSLGTARSSFGSHSHSSGGHRF